MLFQQKSVFVLATVSDLEQQALVPGSDLFAQLVVTHFSNHRLQIFSPFLSLRRVQEIRAVHDFVVRRFDPHPV